MMTGKTVCVCVCVCVRAHAYRKGNRRSEGGKSGVNTRERRDGSKQRDRNTASHSWGTAEKEKSERESGLTEGEDDNVMGILLSYSLQDEL